MVQVNNGFTHYIFLLHIVWNLMFKPVSLSGEIRTAKLRRINGRYFQNSEVIQELVLRHFLSCVSYCDYVTDCVSVSWNGNTKVCQLSSVDVTHERFVLYFMLTSSEWTAAVKLRYKVFNMQGPSRYSLDYAGAVSECSDNGYVIADPEDMVEARDAGFHDCILFNMQGPSRYSLDYAGAVSECSDNGYIIADPEDMIEARDAGFHDCICGWVSDGTNVIIQQFYDGECWSAFNNGYAVCGKAWADVFCKYIETP